MKLITLHSSYCTLFLPMIQGIVQTADATGRNRKGRILYTNNTKNADHQKHFKNNRGQLGTLTREK
jgi:hypothetical protein